MTATPRRVTFTVQGVPLLATNELKRIHPAAYAKHVEEVARHIAAELAQQGIRTATRSWQPLRYVQVVVVLRHQRNADADGKYGYVKSLLDALKRMHGKTNPHGLGVIVDDSDGEHDAPGYIKALTLKQIYGEWAWTVELTEVQP